MFRTHTITKVDQIFTAERQCVGNHHGETCFCTNVGSLVKVGSVEVGAGHIDYDGVEPKEVLLDWITNIALIEDYSEKELHNSKVLVGSIELASKKSALNSP